MSGSLHFTLPPATLEALERAINHYGEAVVLEMMAVGWAEYMRNYFLTRNQEPNKQGWPKQGFWANIARGTQGILEDNAAMVYMPEPFRHKVTGGTIRPINRKFLTLPLNSTAYGRKAEEFAGIRVGYFKGVGLCLYLSNGTEKVPMYGLRRSVSQRPDPRALPTDAEMEAALLTIAQDIGATVPDGV